MEAIRQAKKDIAIDKELERLREQAKKAGYDINNIIITKRQDKDTLHDRFENKLGHTFVTDKHKEQVLDFIRKEIKEVVEERWYIDIAHGWLFIHIHGNAEYQEWNYGTHEDCKFCNDEEEYNL